MLAEPLRALHGGEQCDLIYALGLQGRRLCEQQRAEGPEQRQKGVWRCCCGRSGATCWWLAQDCMESVLGKENQVWGLSPWCERLGGRWCCLLNEGKPTTERPAEPDRSFWSYSSLRGLLDIHVAKLQRPRGKKGCGPGERPQVGNKNWASSICRGPLKLTSWMK